jgi:hypothetical protein
MFNKFLPANLHGRSFDEIRVKGPDEERQINERLSRIEESYVDAAIRKVEKTKRNNSQNRLEGFTN